MSLIKRIKNLIKGNYQTALENGLIVGEGVSVVGGGRGVIFGSEPYLITLGDHCRISMDVMFVTHDGGTWAFRDLPGYENIIKYGRIKVGAYSFIGARSIIMPGVTIGERCVIGAGSVVTSDIPDGTVAAGVPAKRMMSTMEYADRCKKRQVPYDINAYMVNKRAFLTDWLK